VAQKMADYHGHLQQKKEVIDFSQTHDITV
jgi:hypothetical protein